MKHTTESLNKLSKAELAELVLKAEGNTIDLTPIAGTPATEAVIENGITTMPAKEAIPGISITDKINAIPAVKAYRDECAKIDAENALIAEKNKPIADAQAKIDAITEANNKILSSDENKAIAEKMATLKDMLKSAKNEDQQDRIREKIRTEKAKIKGLQPIPDELLDAVMVETVKAKPYPSVPNLTVTATLPLSFLLGAKGSVSATKVAKVKTGGNKREWEQEHLDYIKNQLASGAKFTDIYNHLVTLGYTEGQAKGKINTMKK